MRIDESLNTLKAIMEVAQAFADAKGTSAEIDIRIGDYCHIMIDLRDMKLGGDDRDENRDDLVRSAMRTVMGKLGTPKILRGEYGFKLVHKGVEFDIWGYPTKYSVMCEKRCFAVADGKKIPISLGEEISLETELPD